MKIRHVKSANRRSEFQIETRSGATYTYPYAKCTPHPSADDRVSEVFVDKELGNEAFTYGLESGAEGSIHIEQVLEYNGDPNYLANLLIYRLTVEAQRSMETCGQAGVRWQNGSTLLCRSSIGCWTQPTRRNPWGNWSRFFTFWTAR